MQLGFVSAFCRTSPSTGIIDFAAETSFGCVEWMCWPPEKANRRYAGVTHIDVVNLTPARRSRIRKPRPDTGVAISGLGYYPNPLDPDPEHRRQVSAHLKKVIEAAARLETKIVNTFVGRDGSKMIADNWPIFEQVWPISFATPRGTASRSASRTVRCSSARTNGLAGGNLAHSPAIWKTMFEKIPSRSWGLNFDPSHLIWQWIDGPTAALARIRRPHRPLPRQGHADRLSPAQRGRHVRRRRHRLAHAEAARPGRRAMGPGSFRPLTDAGYNGPVCIEVEESRIRENPRRPQAIAPAEQAIPGTIRGPDDPTPRGTS